MKKIKLFGAIILLVALLSGGVFITIYFSKPSEDKKIVTTIFPIYDICREIMGDESDIMLLQDNAVDMHSFSPTASDMKAISKCELFIFIGGESDDWVGDVILSTDNVNRENLSLINEIDKLEESDDNILEGHEHHDDHHDEHHDEDGEKEYDEHIWLSLNNAIKMVEVIKRSLTRVYPERTELFNVNAEEYLVKLRALELDYRATCSDRDTPLIIADRFPFRYLTNDYDINYYACFSGCSTEIDASINTIVNLIEKINENEIDYIFVLESSRDHSVASQIVNNDKCRKGVQILELNSCQSIQIDNLDTMSYLDIMQSNLNNLKKVFN